jgi:hypothetical protein
MCEIYVWERYYPNRTFTPACEKAKALARIAGAETLTEETLELVKEMGLQVRFKSRFSLNESLFPAPPQLFGGAGQ